MRLLITGAAGFVGHHLVEGVLKLTDWEIVILDCLTYAGSLNRLTDTGIWEQEKHRVKFIWHDLKAPISKTTHRMIGKVDYVWHLAAESHIWNSLIDAVPFAYNVVGTTNLLEYLKHYQPNLKRYIGFNTDECFGPAEQGVFCKEDDKFYPSNPYSGSKAGQWCMEYAFAHSFKMPISMVHSMNVFGERQHLEKFIPMTTKNILEGKLVVLHGIQGTNDISSRCWIHAREVCNALLFLTEKAKNEESYNIVGEERNVLNVANLINQVIKGEGKFLKDNEVKWIDYHLTRPGHDLRYALDGLKLKKMGFEYKMGLDESFEKTIRWMIQKENLRWLNL